MSHGLIKLGEITKKYLYPLIMCVSDISITIALVLIANNKVGQSEEGFDLYFGIHPFFIGWLISFSKCFFIIPYILQKRALKNNQSSLLLREVRARTSQLTTSFQGIGFEEKNNQQTKN